jgi:exodeoxyribonuclease VII small subunit
MAKKIEEKISFEDAMERLEGIVDSMESGQLPLEEIIQQYENGMKYVEICTQKLKAAEEKIVLLTKTRSGEIKRSTLDANRMAQAEEEENTPPRSNTDETSLF